MRLKTLRKEKGISQLKLAMDLHLTQNTISRYENGTHEADYKTLIALADYFNVSIDYLLERTDNPTFCAKTFKIVKTEHMPYYCEPYSGNSFPANLFDGR